MGPPPGPTRPSRRAATTPRSAATSGTSPRKCGDAPATVHRRKVACGAATERAGRRARWRSRPLHLTAPTWCASLHALAKVEQDVIRGVDTNQPQAWILDVEDDVDRGRQHRRKYHRIEPATGRCGCCALSDQHGADHTQRGEQSEYREWRMRSRCD